MCDDKDRMESLLTRLEACEVSPERIARLESYQQLVNAQKRSGEILTMTWEPDFNKPGLRFVHSFGSDFVPPKLSLRRFKKQTNCCTKLWIWGAVITLLAIGVGVIIHYELHTVRGFSQVWFYWENIDLHSEQCTVDMPSLVQDTFRHVVDCAMCADVDFVHRVSDLTPAAFESKYAYSGLPVVVVDGQRGWTASDVFSFSFFRSIYSEDSPVWFNLNRECQFFPYQTSFKNLKEVFNMTKNKAQALDGDPWYIGWSNCDSSAATVLREHYRRPYFLPSTSEASKTDWIFMGMPGHGAHLHIDHVGNPSWQAQIRGRKRWSLEPSPECFFQCSPLEVTVYPGEIIVLDTNIWYHGTNILPGEMSITIGSEYD